ncbi:MAG: 50S ribosomal protein L10 [Thermomicrobium sp.]|nr:50S ribosomal protein L10 [Thermomicrobium sp.]MDW7981662.1 50S ribosomal protein L10 [Thermomicrobium sp.]
MPTPEKARQIDEISDILRSASVAILTDYRGLNVADLTTFRRRLQEQQANVRVVKNTLTRIAAERVGKTNIVSLLEGPTALVHSTGDPVVAAKLTVEFARQSRILTVKGALLGDQLLSAADVEALATLPPREELLAKVVGGLQAPLYGLVSVLSGPIRGLLYVLQARARQLEGPSSTEAA